MGAEVVPYPPTKPTAGPFGIVQTRWSLWANGVVSVRSAGFTHYFRVDEGGTISKVRIHVLIQSGNICVAAYRNSGSGLAQVPGTLLATSGSVLCPVVNSRDVPLGTSVDLLPGDWLALGADNVTAKFLGLVGNGGDTIVANQSGSQAVFPAPTTPAMTADSLALFALVGVP